MAQRSRGELVALLLLYVLPLAGTVVLLFAVGLPVLGGALVAIELTIVSLVTLARRRPERTAREPVSGSLVVGVLGVLLVVAVVALTLTTARA